MSDKLPYYLRDEEIHVHWVGEKLVEFGEDERHGRTAAGLFEIENVNKDVLDRIDCQNALDARLAMQDAEKTRRLIQAIGDMYEALQFYADKANWYPEPTVEQGPDGHAVEGSRPGKAKRKGPRVAQEALPDLDVDVEEAYGWEPKPKRPSRRDVL